MTSTPRVPALRLKSASRRQECEPVGNHGGVTALIGFVRHETVTIHYPIASTADQQDEFEAAEQFIVPNFSQVHTASRQRGKT